MIVDRYYYHQLNKQEQAIYKAFYNGAMVRTLFQFQCVESLVRRALNAYSWR